MSTLPASPTATRILHCALDLFATKGYDATSVREICMAAGVSKPTLYHFFGNKEGVFVALVGGTLDEMHDEVRRGLGAAGGLDQRLREVVRLAFRAARERPRLWRFVFGTVWCPTRAPLSELHRRYDEIAGTLAAAIDEGVAAGEIPAGSTHVRRLVLFGTVSEALSNYLILGRPDLTNELADELVDAVLAGWRCPPATTSTATAGPAPASRSAPSAPFTSVPPRS